jgi:hypothetical protein
MAYEHSLVAHKAFLAAAHADPHKRMGLVEDLVQQVGEHQVVNLLYKPDDKESIVRVRKSVTGKAKFLSELLSVSRNKKKKRKEDDSPRKQAHLNEK